MTDSGEEMQALVVRLRTVEQERDAWRTRCAGLAGERDSEREQARRLRGSGSYRLGRTLVSFAREPLQGPPRLIRRLVGRIRRRPDAPARRTRTAKRPLPARLYVAMGLDLPALRELVQTLRRRLTVEPDHRAVVLTDNPEFSLLRKAGLILEYLPDRWTWERHRPDRAWDEVLAGRLSRLYAEHAATHVVFVDPERPPALTDLLDDTTPSAPGSLQQT
ncbi:hypothetical protein FHR83_000761 [Actinoplanes campanulatus]|uniref:Uncharacterized protein n=1 Tax=Actinoplanes campanulatus TaxID=113559 RepID=A0A7W5ABQ1_9ACTN|nr:hypothetical protein [Actinoplanes campanulatus]MBB3093127.1 hypothetical protein [Actinoplanes campanulatus]GGN01344.1 hypothetical protein GCM10010109_06890 [Actinoplanes campanulatus]GID33777.1 hypothetical protein Aca09nite_02830 [Actinoplanes campanulatus]